MAALQNHAVGTPPRYLQGTLWAHLQIRKAPMPSMQVLCTANLAKIKPAGTCQTPGSSKGVGWRVGVARQQKRSTRSSGKWPRLDAAMPVASAPLSMPAAAITVLLAGTAASVTLACLAKRSNSRPPQGWCADVHVVCTCAARLSALAGICALALRPCWPGACPGPQ